MNGGFDLGRQYKCDYDTREQCVAFAHFYEDQASALEAAEAAGLYPVVESYGTGITTIRVMPEGIRPPHEIRIRSHGDGKMSGLYVPAI